jgi:hypothetical protein
VDFVAPDTYSVISSEATGETQQICKTQSAAGSWSETCLDVLATVTGQAVVEAVWNSEAIWYRECDGAASSCDGVWQELPYVAVYAPPLGPHYASLPNWHLEALKGARDIRPVEGQGTVGQPLHFQARFNPIRVFLGAEKSFYGDEFVSVGGGCSVSGSIGFGSDATPKVEETCSSGERDTLTELAEGYDTSPLPIDIWLSPTDATIQSIVAMVPQPLLGDPEINVEIEYSRINAVEIEIPPKE